MSNALNLQGARLGIALIGFGYWGPNLARNASSCDSTNLIVICELSESRRHAARKLYPNVKIVDSLDLVITDPQVDAVMIATPVATHFQIAKSCLNAKKHIFVEKPLCSSVGDANELVHLAKLNDVLIHVDHTFLYTSAVEEMKQYVESGMLGDLLYFDSVRVNLGIFQSDVDVMWDLAVHDLAILRYVTDRKPITVSATGTSHPNSKQISAAFMTLVYDDLFVAHIHVSWMSPVKIRRTILSGSRKMLVYDDLETNEKIKIYDSAVEFSGGPEELRELLVSYRIGDMISPRLRDQEALQSSLVDFSHSIQSGRETRTAGNFGLEAVAMLEAATQSLKLGGSPVKIGYDNRDR